MLKHHLRVPIVSRLRSVRRSCLVHLRLVEAEDYMMIEPQCRSFLRFSLIVRVGALAAFTIFTSGGAISLDMKKNVRKASPTLSSRETRKPAARRNSLRPGNYYQELIVYCRDSNDMTTYFCFWITD